MPLTKLDNTAALTVIDLQKGTVVLPTVHTVGEIIGNVLKLLKEAPVQ